MPDRLAVAGEPRGAVGQVALVLLLADRHAEVRLRAAAVHALAALGREQRHDAVAGGDGAHALADRLDRAAALVAEHRRRVAGRVGAGRRVEVGVADAAGEQAHEHLAGAGPGELDVLHGQGRPELLEDRSTNSHRRSLCCGAMEDLADLGRDGDAAPGADRVGARRRVRGSDPGRPEGVPAQVPQDGRRPVRVLPRQRVPVLRRRRRARGPLGRRAHEPRLDPGRPARRELRHLHGRRRHPRLRRQRLRRGLPRATSRGTSKRMAASLALLGLRQGALGRDDRRDDPHLRGRLPRAGARVPHRRPRRRVPAHAREHRRRAALRAARGAAGEPHPDAPGDDRDRGPRAATSPTARACAGSTPTRRPRCARPTRRTSTRSPTSSASTASPTRSRTSSGAPASASAAPGCRPTTC